MNGAKGFEERKQSEKARSGRDRGKPGPRIRELREQIDELEGKRLELVESIRDTKVELLEAPVVKAYGEDLRSLLRKGSIVEQKSFLCSFVKRIEVNPPQVIIDYTIPSKQKR